MIDKVKDIRKKLKYSWNPFFSRFGKLTDIQIEVIPKILEGKNLLISSPTASGKTEAVIAPTSERLKLEKWKGLSVIYISPTRALANDIFERISNPLKDMHILTEIKHGDKPYLSNKKIPNLLITTPESLDSLICRKSSIFRNLKTLIIDEIHLIDNTYRGDQLRLLIWRLKEIVNKKFNIYLLSATISLPENVGKRYIEEFDIVNIKGSREIKPQFANSYEEIYYLYRNNKWKKLLFFCNSRKKVEDLNPILIKIWKSIPIVVHHGSLSRKNREDAENTLKQSRRAICIATSTLEVGIDIGTIDAVVLVEIPWSLSSFLQRVGRANRKEKIINVICFFNSPKEKVLYNLMINTAIKGIFEKETYKPDISVGIQQIFSYLFQYKSVVSIERINSLLSNICTDDEIELILQHLIKEEYISKKLKKIFPLTKLLDLGEKGIIHSNIPNNDNFTVIDIESGNEIGTISGDFDKIFLLGGKVWKVVKVVEKRINVISYKDKIFSQSYFKPHKKFGAFFKYLPESLKYED